MGDNLHLPHVPKIELEPKTDRDIKLSQSIRILRKIADGGMGTVYLAKQFGSAGFSKTVAIKTVRPDRLHDKKGIERFVDEANLVGGLVHENICQVYTLERHGGQFLIVMEYIPGLGLDKFLKAHSDKGLVPPVDYSAFIASRVCRALDYAYTEHGIVHRDVNPPNIMLRWDGVIKLTDFGVARVKRFNIDGTLAEDRVLTGKPNYMSPEQSRAEPVDARSDIYCLGLCLHEWFTGKRVFDAKTIAELYEQQKREIPEPRMLNAHVPRELSNICMKALNRDPNKRFQSSKKFGDQLEYFMYRDKWGPTNGKLADYLQKLKHDRILN